VEANGSLGQAVPVNPPLPDPVTRTFITTGCMMAAVMVALDGTIANVALPHMQSAMLASSEQVVWILTSFFIASAIAIPLAGWLAGRVGRKRVMVASVVGFTLASLACAMAVNINQMVVFRIVQGACGAALVPLSQAVMLDINPAERHGKAMAIFGMGAILGPVVGPTLGGWLTESFNWRWIFLINLPIGLIAFFLLSTFLDGKEARTASRFDGWGFLFLSLFIASLQLMLDRGQQLDWFDSREIQIEATLAGLFGFLACVHMLTVRDPFIKPRIFMDRNFLLGTFIGLIHAALIFAVLALLAPMMQKLLGYPVMLTGLITAPRGLGTMAAMFLCGVLVGRVDARYLMAAGLAIGAVSLFLMAGFSLEADSDTIMWVGAMQGFGGGMVFVPLTTIMFATLDPSLRNECSALISLIRNMGAAVTISMLQALTIRNAATVHARLTEGVRPDNPVFPMALPDGDFGLPGWVAGMDMRIAREATMVAYVDTYWLLGIATALALPLCFMLKRPTIQER
jgi:MFS transporter, DHA2 family, multidrug resistance protein